MIDFNVQASSKNQFKFNELSALADVKPYVLRFWESEFDQISPSLDSVGDKIYSTEDLEAIKNIKSLLFDEKLNIQEAKYEMERMSLPATPVIEEINSSTNSVTSQLSSLEMMKKALGDDLKRESEVTVKSIKSFNDNDVIQLIHARKKVLKVSSRIESIISQNNW